MKDRQDLKELKQLVKELQEVTQKLDELGKPLDLSKGEKWKAFFSTEENNKLLLELLNRQGQIASKMDKLLNK